MLVQLSKKKIALVGVHAKGATCCEQMNVNERLLHKLNYFGVRNRTLEWIKSFLRGRSQRVQVNGEKSSCADVISGVPQGTVLGPFLFITYINDIVCNLNSKIKLFADDAVMCREIWSSQDEVTFRNDSITDWAKTWQMSLNFDKCNVMSITCLLYTSPSPRDLSTSRMPSSA